MPDLSTIVVVVNAVLLLLVFILGIRMLSAASKYLYNVGDFAKQTVFKWKILKSIVWITAAGLVAAVFNILFA